MEKGAPMQIAKNRVATIAATVCMIVACALALTAVTPPAIAVADTHTLTVKAPEGTNLAKDIAAGDVTVSVDVYQVANATYDPMYDMYEYALIDKYAKAEGLQERLDKALKGNGGSE
jgi:hypothetical protein